MLRLERRYAILFSLGTFCAASAYFGRGSWVFDAFGPNLAAGFFGSLTTVVLIDRASERRITEERKIVGRVASRQLRRPITLMVQLFADMIKAASPPHLQDVPFAVQHLFNDDNSRELDYLDLYSKSGQADSGDWIGAFETWLAPRLDEFSSVVDKFVTYLPAQLVAAIEDLNADSFVRMLAGYPGFRRKRLAAGDQRRLFTLNGTASLRNVFFAGLLSLIREYENFSGDVIPLPEYYLRGDVEPLRGSGRVSTLAPPVYVGNPPLSSPGDVPYRKTPA